LLADAGSRHAAKTPTIAEILPRKLETEPALAPVISATGIDSP
jgi:hypothetical protein